MRNKLTQFGIFINLMCAIVFIAWPIKYYKDWDSINKPFVDKWIVTDEKLLHLQNYELLPGAAIVMVISAIILWKQSKD